MKIDVNVDGFEDVAEGIAGLSAGLLEAARKGLLKGMQPMVAAAKMRVDVTTSGTGQLRGSIGSRAEVQGTDIVGDLHASAGHAVFVEMGTGPKGEASHEGIAPEANPTYTATGWTYKDPKTGEFVHTMGQPARPYLYPAYKQFVDKLPESVRVSILKAYKGG